MRTPIDHRDQDPLASARRGVRWPSWVSCSEQVPAFPFCSVELRKPYRKYSTSPMTSQNPNRTHARAGSPYIVNTQSRAPMIVTRPHELEP